jgi:hypothetical protein
VTPDSSLGPCEQFTELESHRSTNPARCEVCDHSEAAHGGAGRRTLTGGEIEELRRRIIIERFERQQQERQRSNGSHSDMISANGDPEMR